MKPYRAKTPGLIRRLYAKRIWKLPTSKKVLYLTFDDGPIPEVTPWVLETLDKYKAKATFFCIGSNALEHPAILKNILQTGHRLGNHTQHHKSAFKQSTAELVAQVNQCHNTFLETLQTKPERTKLFRPPYGKLKSAQAKALYKRGYQVVMWNVLSADFDTSIPKEQCLQNVLKYAKSGSIIVFHDSLKAQERMHYALPKVLEHFTNKGFKFKCIP